MSDSITRVIYQIKSLILQGQSEAARRVNLIQLNVYFQVGKCIAENSRHSFWGTNALSKISSTLRAELPGLRGFSVSSLKNMRLFYEEWPELNLINSPIAIGESNGPQYSPIAIGESDKNFPWEEFFRTPFTSHLRIIEKVKDKNQRLYYIRKCAAENLSVSNLERLIIHDDFHSGVIPGNFSKAITDEKYAQKAISMFKDSYLLDFINVEEIGIRDLEDIDERVVEKEIIHNIKKFIMTFGKDFAFVGNQYHLEAFSNEFFPDLLFFNRELNCLVVVELKTGDFKTSYLGQLMTYLRILDDKIKKPHENPSIGIILCKNADKDFVEYVIQDYAKPMGVATYRLSEEMPRKLRDALPDVEELKKLL